METKDCNGNVLNNGDSVQLTKDLKGKGTSKAFKRGDVMKNIKLIEDDPANVECRLGKTTMVIKTEYLKKR